jgi:alpha-ribazole phosphatase
MAPATDHIAEAALLHAWRHPRVAAAQGRCIGITDLPVDARKARRLARRIHVHAHRLNLPLAVATGSLQRSRAVGRALRRLGWIHHVDVQLNEASFGAWDGLRWAQIEIADIDRWVEQFLHHAPGGGESAAQVIDRVRRWQPPSGCRVIVTHGGWLSAARCLEQGLARHCSAAQWPPAPGHGRHRALDPATLWPDRQEMSIF